MGTRQVRLQKKTFWYMSLDDILMGSQADKVAFRNGLDIKVQG